MYKGEHFLLEVIIPTVFLFSGEMITMQNGKRQMIFRRHTYFKLYCSRDKTRWGCTKYPKCKAYLLANDNLIIHSVHNEHNHGEQNLYRSKKGIYIKF